ncbi:P-loop containing nucleoside triphosphate hydrolases superfamily protein [Perilla frutescens var. hirtella]|uniref:RNA helicase n=1 Tax=Perilla frutescens var. hirtella TaxID=608512 RepID=A0AAD4ITR5_PERFH|nr:P-loop containing nucleoside triphosphate hydrolases superfamily protein [Perilla frutescens var. hirtella]
MDSDEVVEAEHDSTVQVFTSGGPLYSSARRFEDLNLSTELLKGLYVSMKFEKPSKIQEISLPMVLNPPYKNLIAQAHNGSRKTTCFVLGMLSRVDPKMIAPQALYENAEVLMAVQNMKVLLKMGKFTGITSELVIQSDQANYVPVHKRMSVTAQVIIGTPGTIHKWLLHKKLGLSLMKILVFDEAHQMLATSGFRDVSVTVMKAIVKADSNCQVLLFSATFNEDTTIHGALKQEDRDKIIREFRDGLTQALISTDLLARGFDQIQINLVINYDLPLRYENRSEPDYEVYLHRAGRAGRFGRKGVVFNLLCHDSDDMIMNKIEKYLNSQITEDSLSLSEVVVCTNACGSVEQRERIQVCSTQCWAIVRLCMHKRSQGEPLQTFDPEIEATIRHKHARRRRAMAGQQPAAPVTADQMRRMQQQLEEIQR